MHNTNSVGLNNLFLPICKILGMTSQNMYRKRYTPEIFLYQTWAQKI